MDSVRYQAEENGTIGLTIGNFAQIEIGITQPLFVLEPLGLVWPLFVLKGRDRARVVGPGALIVVARRAVPLEVCDWDDRLVCWELLVVHTETMTVGVWVREKTGLQDRVR